MGVQGNNLGKWEGSWLGATETDPNRTYGTAYGTSTCSGLLVDGSIHEPVVVKGGGGGKPKRKRVLKKDIYGAIYSAYEEVFARTPTQKVVKEVAEQVVEIDDHATYLELQSRIIQILRVMEEEEDEESALFAML